MTVVLHDDVLETVRELASIREQMAQLRKAETKARDAILAALGDSDVGITASGAPAVHLIEQHRRGVDRARLEAMFPEVFDAVVEDSVSVMLKLDLE